MNVTVLHVHIQSNTLRYYNYYQSPHIYDTAY
jgi:hypothetical protein